MRLYAGGAAHVPNRPPEAHAAVGAAAASRGVHRTCVLVQGAAEDAPRCCAAAAHELHSPRHGGGHSSSRGCAAACAPSPSSSHACRPAGGPAGALSCRRPQSTGAPVANGDCMGKATPAAASCVFSAHSPSKLSAYASGEYPIAPAPDAPGGGSSASGYATRLQLSLAGHGAALRLHAHREVWAGRVSSGASSRRRVVGHIVHHMRAARREQTSFVFTHRAPCRCVLLHQARGTTHACTHAQQESS
jgi:hypothetical protein